MSASGTGPRLVDHRTSPSITVRAYSPYEYVKKSALPSLAFSPDGRFLAIAGFDRPTEVREARTGKLVARLRIDDFARSVGFSPDGRFLAMGLTDGRTQLWSTESWKPVGRALEGQRTRVISVTFTPDSRTLATSAADGTVLLWDVATGKQIGSPLSVAPESYVSSVLSRDGTRLFAVSNQGPGVRWEISPEVWKRHACLVAGRELTAREWADALPERPYRTVCGRG